MLVAAIGDVALPSWRAGAIEVFRLWRDHGYAIGALPAGVSADAMGIAGAMWFVTGVTLRMEEACPNRSFSASRSIDRNGCAELLGWKQTAYSVSERLRQAAC
jgi:hypothetical protein